jgi:MSHA biogenesis protein MshG
MSAVGEETGAVDKLLHDVADFYEEEVDYDLTTLSQAIEPILLVFMGIMVVVLALGVFLPMWELSSAMKR